jgi:hypothetical protein
MSLGVPASLTNEWRAQKKAREPLGKARPMSIQTATPYLILGGRAQKALALYTRALGAKTEVL